MQEHFHSRSLERSHQVRQKSQWSPLPPDEVQPSGPNRCSFLTLQPSAGSLCSPLTSCLNDYNSLSWGLLLPLLHPSFSQQSESAAKQRDQVHVTLLLEILEWLPIEIKSLFPFMAYKLLHTPHLTPHLLTHRAPPPRALHLLLPQGLCTCCCLCLECSSFSLPRLALSFRFQLKCCLL